MSILVIITLIKMLAYGLFSVCLPVAVPPVLSFPFAALQYGRLVGSGHL